MDRQYTSMWQFMRRNPAGKLLCATGLAIGISAAYALTLPKADNPPKYTAHETANREVQQNRVYLSELSDILR